jgi:hypothetical protein
MCVSDTTRPDGHLDMDWALCQPEIIGLQRAQIRDPDELCATMLQIGPK